MQLLLASIAVSALMLCPRAEAFQQLLWDDFNSENNSHWALDYSAFHNWTVGPGTVDLIGVGSDWNWFPSHGLYVDLDGSTHQAGTMTSSGVWDLTAGAVYKLEFDLAGSQRSDYGATDTVIVVALGTFNKTFTLSAGAPFQTYTEYIGFSNTGQGSLHVAFAGQGGDNVGLLLDNVRLTKYDSIYEANGTPELSSGALLLFGMLPVGLAWRKRRKNA